MEHLLGLLREVWRLHTAADLAEGHAIGAGVTAICRLMLQLLVRRVVDIDHVLGVIVGSLRLVGRCRGRPRSCLPCDALLLCASGHLQLVVSGGH